MIISAYLEDFRIIKLILRENLWNEEQKWYAKREVKLIPLLIVNSSTIYGEKHLFLKSDEEILPNLDYKITNQQNIEVDLRLGKITRSTEFEKKYSFLEWLGFRYQKEKTVFRVWSPVSKEMYLVLNGQKKKMDYMHNGVWQIEVQADCDRMPYHYCFRINDEYLETIDPYGISGCANNRENYVVDLTKTYQMKHPFFYKEKFKKNDAIIYELSVRDATSKTNAKQYGTFKALKESIDKNYGLGVIKELGITHLQLLPIFTFGGIDENIKDSHNPDFLYNWGYNPMQYFIPSGFYTTNPNDPYLRMNELKELVDVIHGLGIAVNMDVVYNHVYISSWFPMEKLVPGYTFRTDENGFLTDSSWCGNDLKTDHIMVRKLIIDSILHFQRFYLIDGFRFDLMGLIDLDTIKEVEYLVRKTNPLAMIYGEGWNMDVRLQYDKRANLDNAFQIPNIGFFNDYFRNTAKQLLTEKSSCKDEVLNLFQSLKYYTGDFINASQSINYVECHDNETIYDYLLEHQIQEEQIPYYVRLALGLVIFSQGIPFIHAGMEYFRTKNGSHNSYNQGDIVNGINWNREKNLVQVIKEMIEIRNEYPHFHYDERNKLKKNVKIETNSEMITIRIIDMLSFSIQIIVKRDFMKEIKYFAPYTKIIFDGEKRCDKNVDYFCFEKPGVYIFRK